MASSWGSTSSSAGSALWHGTAHSAALENTAALLGRALLATIFLLSGVNKITDWDGTEAYMASQGMPMIPLLHVGAIVAEVGGGLLVLLGWKARWAGLMLFLFLIPVTLTFHRFWSLPQEQQAEQMIHFLKNQAIMGGLLMLFAFGGGRYSVEVPPASRKPSGVG